MELSEEKELKNITDEFGKGIKAFKEQECSQAVEIFGRIVEKYSESEFSSVLEIQARAKVYQVICRSRINPVKIPLEDNEDYLFDGIYHLNAGNPDKALERFEHLKKANYGDPYLNYLLALVYLKKEETDTCLEHLKKAVEKDATYKIVAHNEPDFDPLFENDVFVSLIEEQF
jgi:tetratricopeptide (TPR) repeat protein